jgi:hypothetical protein
VGTSWYVHILNVIVMIIQVQNAACISQGAPIAGYLLNAYGGETSSLNAYKPAIYYAGSMTLASAGFIAALRLNMTTKVLARV